MSQLTRDYKGTGRHPLRPGGMREFALGVLAGALLAGGIAALIAAHGRHRQAQPSSVCSTASATAPSTHETAAASGSSVQAAVRGPAPAPQGRAPAETAAAGDAVPAAGPASASPAPQYDFYSMLRKLTVPVPGERAAARARTHWTKLKVGPPRYLVQVGSYTSDAQAQRLRKRLGQMGISARIRRVTERGMTLNRVQIGPVDAAGLRWIRGELAAAGMRPLVIPVGGR
jgi:cell division protein FtsN